MHYPKGYEWLGRLGLLPRTVTEGLKEIGVKEVTGNANNPVIMGWAKETGLQASYTADAVPWCGLFMAVVAKRAEKPFPRHPLWALNWEGFGTKGMQPCLGDVLVFVRTGGGHVGVYIAEDQTHYHLLGGNQNDEVNIRRIEKRRLHAVRRPPILRFHARSAIPYIVSGVGELVTSEA